MEQNNVFKKFITCILIDVFKNGIPSQKLLSPVINMYKIALKYKFDNILRQIIMNKNVYGFSWIKSTIKHIVWKHEKDRWKASCLLYKELDYYNNSISSIRIHPW